MQDPTQDQDLPEQDELTTLKARADLMGLSYHPSIGVDKLRAKIQEVLASTAETPPAEPPQTQPDELTKGNPDVVDAAPTEETPTQKRIRKRREAAALVRIRVTCMNPHKSEWEGEIFTAGNSVVGTFTKYVPFNTDEGWHVPSIIYKQIVDRQCQIFVTTKDKHGNSIRKGKLIREFAVEVLPQLTPAELKELARRQAMANNTGD